MDTKSKLCKRMIGALITKKTQKQLSIRLMDISTARMINKYCNKEETSLKALFQTCLKHISPVTTPPLLISQAPHSGGSLLNKLFDGHPEIYAYPNALMNSIPAKIPWTEIKLKDDPQPWIDFFLDYLGYQNKPSTRAGGRELADAHQITDSASILLNAVFVRSRPGVKSRAECVSARTDKNFSRLSGYHAFPCWCVWKTIQG